MEGLPSEIQIDPETVDLADWWAHSLLKKRRGEEMPVPLGVVRPRDEDEVALVIRWAAAQGVAIIPRGGGSGVCGGAGSRYGAILLDLTALDRVVEIDATSGVVTAEAGILGPALDSALSVEKLTLGHVPQSFHISTLGGWISTKAIGQSSTRYGGIEDRLLSLRIVLPDGSIVASKETPRSSSGPDWWRLFIGAEGTLGIVTQATLSAFPIPESSEWIEIQPASFETGLDILRAVVQSGVRPSVARLYDSTDASVNFGVLGLAQTLAIFRIEGQQDVVAAEAAAIKRMAAGSEISTVGAGPHWWEHRFEAAETYRKVLSGKGVLGPLGVIDTMEVAARWTALPYVYEKVRHALQGEADLVLAHASHLYPSGANIYFTFLISSAADEDEAQRRYIGAWEAGMQATIDSGATISHHHGIGLLKVPWLGAELGSGMDALMKIKNALDPSNMMNPGVLGL